MAARAGIGQCPEPVQTVRGTVAAQICASSPARLRSSTRRVRRGTFGDKLALRLVGRPERAATFAGLRIQREVPTGLGEEGGEG